MTDGEGERRAKIMAAVEAARIRFLASFDDRVTELENLAAAAVMGDEDASMALQRGLHTIAGTAPTLGLHDLGAAARALEEAIRRGEAFEKEKLRNRLRQRPS